jgi:hypothetical protein
MENGQHTYETSRRALFDTAITNARQNGWPVDDYDIIIVINPGAINYGDDGYCLPPPGFDQTTPPSVPWPLWEPGPPGEHFLNGRFSHIGTLAHEWGHVIGWPDMRGGGLAGLMAQGNCSGPDQNSWSAAPTGLGAYCEWKMGFFDCFLQHGTGGMVHLTLHGGTYTVPARSQNGHSVYWIGTSESAPQYLIEARWVDYDRDVNNCGEIDDRMIMPGPDHTVPEGTDHTQLVIWDRAGCDTEPGWNCVVRNPKSSVTYMYSPASNGGPNFWCLWPGSVPHPPHSPNNVDWTPFTFPNTNGTTALLDIQSHDFNRSVSFEFREDYPQSGTLTISEPVYMFKVYTFTSDVVVADGGVLNAQKPYSGARSLLNFGSGAGVIVESGGSLRVPFYTTRAIFRSATQGQNWKGISVQSQNPSNLFAGIVEGAETGI